MRLRAHIHSKGWPKPYTPVVSSCRRHAGAGVDVQVAAVECEAREIRTPNLLIWSQTRCRCAIAPSGPDLFTALLSSPRLWAAACSASWSHMRCRAAAATADRGPKRRQCPAAGVARAPEVIRSELPLECEAREIRAPNLLIWSQTRCRCAIAPSGPDLFTASLSSP